MYSLYRYANGQRAGAQQFCGNLHSGREMFPLQRNQRLRAWA
jgi:hypothetical protein